MSFARMRTMLEDAGRRRQAVGSSSASSDASAIPPLDTQRNTLSAKLDAKDDQPKTAKTVSDAELCERANLAYQSEDFTALAAGPEHGGPWQRVDSVGRFVLFKRESTQGESTTNGYQPRPEVLCAGRLDASLEEVANVLETTSHDAHNTAMTGLYNKNFIFGSIDRTVACDPDPMVSAPASVSASASPPGAAERLTVKTSSFLRTAMLARNEQWCYLDFFRRKPERDGFTVSQRALPPDEFTPSRISGDHARVSQLHGLSVSCLVDRLPAPKGLRVVYKAWFEPPPLLDQQSTAVTCNASEHSTSQSSSSASPGAQGSSGSGTAAREASERKAQHRRLLALARGVMTLADVVRRRRFGVQVPADFVAFQATNTRCPCCTRSLGAVKLTLATAASVLSSRGRRPKKTRCYLCGYFVCGDCWTAREMESNAGRVASILVCTRCHACVEACDYSELCADSPDCEQRRGPVRVVPDESTDAAETQDSSTTPLLVDFLASSLAQAPPGSTERAAMLHVLRALLHQDEGDEGDGSTYKEKPVESDDGVVTQIADLLGDEKRMPALVDCILANNEKRDHPVSLPEPGHAPPGPIPEHETVRLASLEAVGLLLLARKYAPENPSDAVGIPEPSGGIHELEVLCQLAARTLGADCACVAILSARHNHVVVSNVAAFANAAVPRDQSMCQHTAMGHGQPFLISHPEADVRFHAHDAVAQLPVRFYAGFPILVPRVGDALGCERPSSEEDADVVAVGTLCCLHTRERRAHALAVRHHEASGAGFLDRAAA